MSVEPSIDFAIHGPPGSAPPVLARGFASVREAAADDRDWRLVPCGDDPGADAMHLLAGRAGDAGLIATCTPVHIQAPLLRGMTLTHRHRMGLVRTASRPGRAASRHGMTPE